MTFHCPLPSGSAHTFQNEENKMSVDPRFLRSAPEPNSDHQPQAVLAAMLKGYELFLAARNHKAARISAVINFLRAFYELHGWPWSVEPAAYLRWQAERRDAGKALSTRRENQVVLDGFIRYLLDDDNGWAEQCERLFGSRPRVLVTESNRIRHVEALERDVNVRPPTPLETQTLFDCMDEAIATASNPLPIYRDSMFCKVAYAYGTRRAETCELTLADLHRNQLQPAFGNFGAVVVRNGKAKPLGPQRRRTIYTTWLMRWIVPELERYLDEVRVLFRGAELDPHLFLADHGGPISASYASIMFARWREAAGLPSILTLHSLRHAYATHHIEAGYEGAAIAAQLGHEWETSTATYVNLSDDYRQQALLEAQRTLGGS